MPSRRYGGYCGGLERVQSAGKQACREGVTEDTGYEKLKRCSG